MYVRLSSPYLQPQRKPRPDCSAFWSEGQVLEDGPPCCCSLNIHLRQLFGPSGKPANFPNPPPGIHKHLRINSARFVGSDLHKIKLSTAKIILDVGRQRVLHLSLRTLLAKVS